MKIGIHTLELKNNYGGLLQNYALQTVLKRKGHDVLTIDLIKSPSFSMKIMSIARRLLLRASGNNTIRLRVWATKKENEILSKYTRDFVKRNISTTRKVFSANDLKNLYSEYKFEALVVGSDQIWRRNKNWNSSAFLDFVPKDSDVKKIAYAASFGIDKWTFTKEETEKYASLAKLFNAISVREKSGLDLCRDYLGVDAVHMPDPTMLLDKEDYIDLVKDADIKQSDGDLFTYILDRSNEKSKIVTEISDALSLKPFEVMPEQSFTVDLPNQKFDINKCVFPKVEEWLRGFMDAKFVVTDSFHGTVFAIVFNKPFIAILNSKRGAARFNSLLSLFDLQERLVSDSNKFDKQVIYSKMDFHKLDRIRGVLKEQAHEFLNNALK